MEFLSLQSTPENSMLKYGLHDNLMTKEGTGFNGKAPLLAAIGQVDV